MLREARVAKFQSNMSCKGSNLHWRWMPSTSLTSGSQLTAEAQPLDKKCQQIQLMRLKGYH